MGLQQINMSLPPGAAATGRARPGQKLAVRVARRLFHLPYFDAAFKINLAESISYRAERTHYQAPPAAFQADYKPVGDVYAARPGSLDEWLTERYCLYSADAAARVYRGEIDHSPWPLQPAEAEIGVNTLGDWLNIPLARRPETLHFARSLEVHGWMIEQVS